MRSILNHLRRLAGYLSTGQWIQPGAWAQITLRYGGRQYHCVLVPVIEIKDGRVWVELFPGHRMGVLASECSPWWRPRLIDTWAHNHYWNPGFDRGYEAGCLVTRDEARRER